MFERCKILFPTDFSPYAHHAMRYAAGMAGQCEGEVHILHVLDEALFRHGGGHGLWVTKNELDQLYLSMREHAESRLDHLVRMFAEERVEARAHIRRGKPSLETIDAAEELGCDLIVIATHGRSGFDHLIFGSVCEKVVRHSKIAVLSVKHPEHEFAEEKHPKLHLRRILLPVDFSDATDATLPVAASLCRQFGATLTLLHVAEIPTILPDTVSEVTATLEADTLSHADESLEKLETRVPDIRCNRMVVSGSPHREICRRIEDESIDLVVMPTSGRGVLSHMLFGDVAEKVVRLAKCPVLTVRPKLYAKPMAKVV